MSMMWTVILSMRKSVSKVSSETVKSFKFLQLAGVKVTKQIVCFYISEIEQECDIDVEQVKQSVKSTTLYEKDKIKHYL